MDFLNSINTPYLEALVERYREDPSTVDPTWRAFLEGEGRELVAVAPTAPRFVARSIFSAPGNGHHSVAAAAMTPTTTAVPVAAAARPLASAELLASQSRVGHLIDAYRRLGHLKANLDPLAQRACRQPRELTLEYWGFGARDMAQRFSTAELYGPDTMTLHELVEHLEETYARSIGCEFMHITDEYALDWLKERCERTRNRTHFDVEAQRFILEQLCAAEAFEEFLARKFVGAKRFSLEGGEALIPMLSLLIDESAEHGVRDIVLGMAHRGRLNVLVNVLQKARRAVFREFNDDTPRALIGRGDVKYHLGYHNTHTTRRGHQVHLTLTFNPSHLEAIDPVVEGIVRARQDRSDPEHGRREIMPLLIHGDAAFIGQGLVAETLNLMNLPGYTTGGTIHIVINNQIGFTTEPSDSRSSTYCTDLAKMNEVPIFHVNGEDPEAVLHVCRIAAEFRQRFARDVVIDMYCFRRYGHNEADEPRFTNPVMYQAVDAHPDVHQQYADHLEQLGKLSRAEIDAIYQQQNEQLEREMEALQHELAQNPDEHTPQACYQWDDEVPEADTSIDTARIERLASAMVAVPEGFSVHRILARTLDGRVQMGRGELAMNWGFGESLAFASLLEEGHPVRISGQDSRRGTFGHRHAVLYDQKTGQEHAPLAHLGPEQGPLYVYNSPLSEAAVLGFEFGYSLEAPKTLVIWEAQFGDFANGAQVIIDQFITASEDKWAQRCGVVLLLPHGYEGQGPEHSSARFERFLALCAEDNIQVVNLTTPAQIFHALRRQVKRDFHKPLVVMTPKSLLRHRLATSALEEVSHGQFQRVIPESHLPDDAAVERVIVCTGKVYYDLLERREELGADGHRSAIVRLEQLHPFPAQELVRAVERHAPTAREVVWCQEEPMNMGPFSFLYHRFNRLFEESGLRLRWVNREASASPATGSKKAHEIEQRLLVDDAFGLQVRGGQAVS